ncbi:formate dehydrogenase accessory sulfurtransferase FdhD [Clostridium sp. DJ247]|uniref:formate dehydrogenase accessory sulfurtransferase FdhD n=1 Tax=Clostridium sp. DJ247 TaxID=2726188 RepID=UPI0016269CEE|nr:formate dehydrogenase accessory sulfurtransferase FdhD [Clostridium sp. DJ247]MBC2582334.1 formate dehydrogenase accessory sulfurtransferase FdhD [Clostridium sp. DJ247]
MDKTLECKVIKIEENIKSDFDELLVCEYPLTIYLNKKKIATLLCSPENLKELTLGFLRTERLIANVEEVIYFNLDEAKGIAEVETESKIVSAEKFHSKKVKLENIHGSDGSSLSNFFDSINCDSVDSNMVLPYEKAYEFMEKNLTYSEVFRKTGGVHCVALCDTNDILVICEDVARHNALDKVIGRSLMKNIFLKDKIIILSGRVSLEMILKAAKLQIPIIISKSAPTSLSVALAKKLNITLVGFVRGRKMNIYANEQRIKY